MQRVLMGLVFGGFFLLSQSACATGPFARGGLFDGETGTAVALEQALSGVRAGDIVIISESHGFAAHHANQRAVLNTLRQAGFKVSVGMEFFDYTNQAAIDAYVSGRMTEADFLKAVGWGSIPFAHYREQVLFPASAGRRTIGLNAPRSLSGAVAKRGVDGLTAEEHMLMPPGFEAGNDFYRERFAETMSGHVPASQIERYFLAQSLWDETMAWKALTFIQANPEQTLVIIVGDFHAAYGGGLPDRLRARGGRARVVVSQIAGEEIESGGLESAVRPHPRFGPRGSLVWVVP